MATNITLPDASVRVALDDGRMNPDWYRVLSRLAGLFNDATAAAEEAVTNADLADMAAWTIKMRNAGTTGDPQDVTINGLTEETSVDPTADFVPFWDTGGSVMRKAKPTNLARPTVIASGAISAAATLDIPVDGQAWDVVEILLWNLLPANTNDELYARVSQSSAFLSGASDYAWAYTVNGTRTNDDADSEIEMLVNQSNAAGNLASFVVRLLRPTAASFAKTITFSGGYNASISLINGAGRLVANTNAIEDIRFGYLSGGNIASGYYYALGYRF